jgi:hypothetical protein
MLCRPIAQIHLQTARLMRHAPCAAPIIYPLSVCIIPKSVARHTTAASGGRSPPAAAFPDVTGPIRYGSMSLERGGHARTTRGRGERDRTAELL